jgi:hypothetical protein
MNTFRLTIKVLVIAIFTFAVASMAQAQATRTWVSGVGDDANPCSRTAPCKTFAGAISKTATFGEIDALDSGGFGAVTITKAITIEGGGNIAGVLTSLNGSGVIINAPTDAAVALRNLDFNGIGTAGNGIRILAAKTVVVDHCQIYGFRGSPGRGISDERNTITPIPQLYVNDCYIRDNNGGVAAASAGSNGPIRVTIDNTRIQGNTSIGVFAQNAAVVMVRFSNISGNLSDGVQINSSAQANIISSVLTENQGIAANNVSGTQLSLADTSIINNITGIGGTITSFGNNNVRNNGGGNTLPGPVGQQ